MPIEGLKPIKAPRRALPEMREAVATTSILWIDCHARPSPAMGLQFAKALEPYGLYFLEEPCWPESIDGLAAINAAVSTPLPIGERITHPVGVSRRFCSRRFSFVSSKSPTAGVFF